VLVAEDFNKVVKCDFEGSEEGRLHLWKNKEVDASALAQVVQAGRWDGLEDIEGLFAGVYEKGDKAYLFCDHLGIYPLYYFANKDGVYVSPSVPELLNATKLSLTVCKEGIVSFLLFMHHLADETVFEGVKRCNGGETIVIDSKGDVEERILWKKKHIYQSQSSAGADELGEIFVQGVEKSLSVDDNVLISLSGGFDSRAVLGAVLECVEADRITTATFGGTDTFDFQIGKIVASKAGVKNIAFPFAEEIFDDDFLRRRAGDYGYVYSAFATQPQEMLDYLSGKMSEGNVSIWGVGGDAITGSHLHDCDMDLKKCESFEDMSRLLLQQRAIIPLSVVSKLVDLGENEIVQITAGLIERSVLGEYEKSWQFLDAWDIFVRGRMELASVLPFNEELWSCPHFGREYFNLMSTQCFDEKVHQNIYKRMLASRFKFLFSLPTKRLNGRSLVSSRGRDLSWVLRARADRFNRLVRRLVGRGVSGVRRNYGKDQRFFDSVEGRSRLEHSIDVLMRQDILGQKPKSIIEAAQRKVPLACLLITLGYAFEQ
jgi:hypothetical protein